MVFNMSGQVFVERRNYANIQRANNAYRISKILDCTAAQVRYNTRQIRKNHPGMSVIFCH